MLGVEKPAEYELESLGAAQKLEIENVKINGVKCDLDYAFLDGALVAAHCEFDLEDIAPATISAALDEGFGARGEGDAGFLCDLMGAMTGMDFSLTAALRAGDYYYDWTDAGGAYAALTNRLSDDGDDIDLFCFDAPAILAGYSVSEPAPALNPDGF